jgi:TfuA protein
MSTSPVVFLGPSLSHEEARAILPDAIYLPPIARGDLPSVVAAGARVVGIIDGVFHQRFPVTPSEIKDALKQRITVFGAASMGALRAAEMWPFGMIGVGLVFEWYRRGEICADHEVALRFDPESRRALTVPLVNVRYAVREIVERSVIDASTARTLIAIAETIHYTELRYKTIVGRLDESCLPSGLSRAALVEQLEAFDLKRDDAVTCLERMRGADGGNSLA